MGITRLFYFSLRCYDLGLTCKEIYSKLKYRKFIKRQKQNKNLFSYKKSDKCYVCGNGPSLKKVNLDELDGDTIVMNDHWRIAPNFKTKPTYYIINDDAYGCEALQERLDGVMKCCPEIPHLFTTQIGKAIDSKYSNTNVFYYNHVGKTFKHNYKIDFTKTTYCTWNVVSAAIQLALYLDYKEIYLIGLDYSIFASQSLNHMYDNEGVKVAHYVNLRDRLYKYTFTTHIHYEIAKYAKEHGIKVVNLTSESLLDAYEIDPNSKY